jgi:cold shock CspA family protein/ribosome-associated translation inhibitor RaiA
MEYPTQIVFHNMQASEFIEKVALEKADKLLELYPKIIHCRVMIESPHRHSHQGQLFHVRIILKVPEDDIVITRQPDLEAQHEDVYVALRDAFDAAKRRLKQYHGKIKRHVKHHEEMPSGHVAKIFLQQGFGFVETSDGREVYFDQNSVLGGDFANIEVGQEARLAIVQGEDGPQASTLHIKKRKKKYQNITARAE